MTANTSPTVPNRIRTHAIRVGMRGGLSAFIVGGGHNGMLSDTFSIIGGGYDNLIEHAGYTTIAGGFGNRTLSANDFSTIGGGEENEIEGTAETIAGGDDNLVRGNFGALGGGSESWVTSVYGASAGGLDNRTGDGSILVADSFDVVAGGWLNAARFNGAAVTGGVRNQAEDSMAFIGGGYNNTVNAIYGTIGGGRWSTITTGNAPYATIPGGDSLIANSFAQTVIGFNNIETGTIVQGTPTAGIDTALFIVGNGTMATPSDAFTVSYNGHSTVYQSLPTSAGQTTIMGSTYQDNTIIAWGSESKIGTFTAGLGCTVTPTTPGNYTVTLVVNDPDGNAHTFANGDAAIVITTDKTTSGGAAFASSTPLVWSGGIATFTVTTYAWGTGTATSGIGFQFHVVAQ